MKIPIILIGGGGHCTACIDVIEQQGKFSILGIVDIQEKLSQKLIGYEIIATDSDIPDLVGQYKHFLITIGQIRSAKKRISVFNQLKSLGAKLPVIISPLAYVSRYALIKEGTIVMHHAVVNAGATIARNCIINTKSLIEHDANIGAHCHIATSAVVNGGVKIDSGTFLGSNAVCREYVEIGKECIIGCNAKVIKNIPDGSTIK